MLPIIGGVTVDRVLCFIDAAIDAGRSPLLETNSVYLRVTL